VSGDGYAGNTKVSVEKSQAELKTILRKYGADRFGTMEESTQAFLMFEFKGLTFQMTVPLPGRNEFTKTDGGRQRSSSTTIDAMMDQAIRSRWRALILVVKAKLEAIEIGISTIEKEFLAFVVMPDGRQFADHMLPELHKAVASGQMPKLLLGGPK